MIDHEPTRQGPSALPGPFHVPPFRPAWWLPGGHLQTLGGKYLRPSSSISLRRERIDTPDGDFLDLDFGPDPEPGAPLVLILHGLEGFSRRPYMLHAADLLLRRGIAAACLNFRSCSGEPNRTARLYHSGETGDTRQVLELLARRWPGRALGALGFSLGGNVLLKLLGEEPDGGRRLVQAAVAVSVPYDLAAGASLLERSVIGRFYARYFLGSLKKKVRAKEHLLAPILDLDRVYRARTIREYDDAATAPLHGFRDAAEYYRRSSSGQYLARVRVPALLFHSLNDPFLPSEAIPRKEVAANPRLIPAFVEAGGHVGFVSGRLPGRRSFWAEAHGSRFFAAALR